MRSAIKIASLIIHVMLCLSLKCFLPMFSSSQLHELLRRNEDYIITMRERGWGTRVKISQYWGDFPLAHKIKKVIPNFLDIFLPFFSY